MAGTEEAGTLAPAKDPLLESADGGAGEEAVLDRELRRLETFLAVLGFHHPDSPGIRLRLAASCSAFLLLGVAAPVAAMILSPCSRSGCGEDEIEQFEITVVASQGLLAAVSLACVSRNLFKYGVRKFLFVDQNHGQVERFQKEYASKIQQFFCLLIWWILPCFLVKTGREIIRFTYIFHESRWKSAVVFSASVVSWVYLTTIFLSACCLFSLVCSLQCIHFADYGKLLERDADSFMCLEEHLRLRYYLSKISHRFRIFLLLLFLFVTASQFVTLFQTTGYYGKVNFTKAGDLAISSLVQVVGAVLCLYAAARISHRAQGIASLASRWHALQSCCPIDSSVQHTNSSTNLEATSASLLVRESSETDLESVDNIRYQTNVQLASYLSSYHKRQALVLYLQSNPGGITIFGWTVDRVLLNTLFFLELTLVLFVLGKTIVFPT